jgi:hypothetical protein
MNPHCEKKHDNVQKSSDDAYNLSGYCEQGYCGDYVYRGREVSRQVAGQLTSSTVMPETGM